MIKLHFQLIVLLFHVPQIVIIMSASAKPFTDSEEGTHTHYSICVYILLPQSITTQVSVTNQNPFWSIAEGIFH